ncbi:MAG: hypothetical protein ACR2PV_06460 [Gammaproteobacteria bacterium]
MESPSTTRSLAEFVDMTKGLWDDAATAVVIDKSTRPAHNTGNVSFTVIYAA